jgi:RimJ/RimL family protein N-acetyltransferase
VPYVIVERSDGTALGGCTFKGAPVAGGVEIAYGVAASARGRGIATEAVRQLLRLAEESASVHRVVAEVLPSNIASGKLVARLGFIRGATFVDTDGETVVRWTRELA